MSAGREIVLWTGGLILGAGVRVCILRGAAFFGGGVSCSSGTWDSASLLGTLLRGTALGAAFGLNEALSTASEASSKAGDSRMVEGCLRAETLDLGVAYVGTVAVEGAFVDPFF